MPLQAFAPELFGWSDLSWEACADRLNHFKQAIFL